MTDDSLAWQHEGRFLAAQPVTDFSVGDGLDPDLDPVVILSMEDDQQSPVISFAFTPVQAQVLVALLSAILEGR